MVWRQRFCFRFQKQLKNPLQTFPFSSFIMYLTLGSVSSMHSANKSLDTFQFTTTSLCISILLCSLIKNQICVLCLLNNENWCSNHMTDVYSLCMQQFISLNYVTVEYMHWVRNNIYFHVKYYNTQHSVVEVSSSLTSSSCCAY